MDLEAAAIVMSADRRIAAEQEPEYLAELEVIKRSLSTPARRRRPRVRRRASARR